jgi:DNA-directed RNA polymerase subunit RPC12/RpoP
MPEVLTPCGICGKPTNPAETELIGSTWSPATCPECGRKRLLADGGVVVTLTRQPAGAVFDLGEVQLRPGAIHVLGESGEHYWPFLARHARGDTGVFAGRDSAARGRAFLNVRGDIVSEYRTQLDRRLWIVTHPGHVTLILAPGEF